MSGVVFINYRRGDDPGFTHALYQRLEEAFPADRLFMDVEGHIKPGDDFVHVLNEQVAASDVILAVIGPRWLELLKARAGDADDFVQIEISAALEQNKRVIPVLVGGAEMPRAVDLPEGIADLARRNAVGLRPERFKADCQGLISALGDALEEAEAERVAKTEAERKAAEEARRKREEDEASRAAEAERKAREQAQAGMSAEQIEEAKELANWDFIKDRDDGDELRDHLARFPKGATARYALEKLEWIVWQGLGARPDAAALNAYLQEFPNGAHADETKKRLHKLATEAEKEKREKEDWASALEAGDIDAFNKFLRDWPKGVHSKTARTRIKELKRKDVSPGRRRMLMGMATTVGVGAIGYGGYRIYQHYENEMRDDSLRQFGTHGAKVNSIAISPGGTTLVTAGEDGKLKLWNPENEKEQGVIEASDVGIDRVRFAPNGKLVVSLATKNNEIKVWDVESKTVVTTIKNEKDLGLGLAISHDGQSILTGEWGEAPILWDLATGQKIRTFNHIGGGVWAAAFSADGTRAVTASHDRGVVLWDVEKGDGIRIFEPKKWAGVPTWDTDIAFSADGKSVFTVAAQFLMQYDVNTGDLIRQFEHIKDEWITSGFSLSPNQKYILAGVRGAPGLRFWNIDWTESAPDALHVWDVKTGKILKTYFGVKSLVDAVAIFPDGKKAISGDSKGLLKLWDLTSLAD